MRPTQPRTLDQARDVVGRFVDHYNRVRLHSAVGYIAPLDIMAGKVPVIWADRDGKLEAGRDVRGDASRCPHEHRCR